MNRVVRQETRLDFLAKSHGVEIKRSLRDFKYIVFERKHWWDRKKKAWRLIVAKFTDEILSKDLEGIQPKL